MVAPDFRKKIKAKVGKRAPARANVTDTSFQAAALHVSQQSSVTTTPTNTTSSSTSRGVIITTARGLSLSQLSQQLRHPACAVRVSAVKGLQNILVQDDDIDGQQQRWLPHLSQLITTLGPAATVDEDPGVRQSGLAALQELARQLEKGTTSSQQQRQNSSSSLLIPFAPYLMALTATALNSLDAMQCLDGALVAEWLASLAAASLLDRTTLAMALPQLIPPLTRLLSDHKVALPNHHSSNNTAAAAEIPVGSMRKNNNSNKSNNKTATSSKKRKRGGAALQAQKNKNVQSCKESSTPRQTALSAIHALLQAVSTGSQQHDKGDSADIKSAMSLAPPIQTSRVIFSRKGRPERVVSPIGSLQDLPSWQQLGWTSADQEDSDPVAEQHATRSHDCHHHHNVPTALSWDWNQNNKSSLLSLLSPADSLDLLGKLRDGLVEATQSLNTEQFLLCAVTVRLLLKSESDNTAACATTETDDKRLVKFCCQIAKSLLEWFPLENIAMNTNSEHNNADLCQTLMRLAATVRSTSGYTHNQTEVHRWMAVVADHIQSCLEQDEESMIRGTGNQSFDYVTSPPLIHVLEEILVVPSGRNDLLWQHHAALRSNLVELVGTVFFSPDTTASRARSAAGRAAARMACRWWRACDYSLEQAQQRYGGAVTDLLHGLPQYLVHWRGDYPSETAAVLELLQQVVRRLPTAASKHNGNEATAVSGGSSLVVLSPLRTAVEQLLTTTTETATNVSILEEYPEQLQRQVVCLLTMLSSPSANTVHALGEVCARCRLRRCDNDGADINFQVVSAMVASFIVQCVHSIRKTVPMQVYIGFLVDGTGILKVVDIPVEEQKCMDQFLNDVDAGVAVMADCLVKCGTRKILPMLEALLSVLIKDICDKDANAGNAGPVGPVIQARAALILIARFSMDLSRCNTMDASVFEYLPEGFRTRITDCIFKMLMRCSSDQRFSSQRTWLCPLIAVLSAEPGLLVQGYGSMLSSQLHGIDKSAQIRLLELWLKIVKHPRLLSVLERDAVSMIAAAKELDESYKDEPSSRHVTSRILAELEIFAELT